MVNNLLHLHTAIEMQFSSVLFGNLTMNLEPAFSSLSFSGRKRHTTLILSSAGISRISRSADILTPKAVLTKQLSYIYIKLIQHKYFKMVTS